MGLQIESIAEQAAAKYEAKLIEARSAESIEAALAKQKEGFKEALKLMMELFVQQATVNGGVCVPNGAIAGGKIE